jgi:hypothetical protein
LVEYFEVSREDGLPELVRRWTKHRDETLAEIRVPAPLVVNKKEKRLTVRMVPVGNQVQFCC